MIERASLVQHVRQPDAHTCAQAVAAMLLGVPWQEVFAELPSRKSGTRHRRLIDYLKRKGVRCGDRFDSWRRMPWPPSAIARVRWPDSTGHVVLMIDLHDMRSDGRLWLDPDLDRTYFATLPSDRRYGRGVVTSFLRIDFKEPY